MSAIPDAETFARAIIAASVSYGDNPIAAMQAQPGSNTRRALAPATWGLHEATGVPRLTLCRILGVSADGSKVAKYRGGERFAKAQEAAREAVIYHLRGRALTAKAAEPAPQAAPVPAPVLFAAPIETPLTPGDIYDLNAALGHCPPRALKETPPPAPAAPVEAAAAPAGPETPVAPVEVAAPPPPPVPAHRPTAGAITGLIRPPFPMRDPSATRGVRSVDRPVTDLVLEALARGPANSMSLASILDRKEMAVSSALSQLAHDGLVASEPVETGPRRLVWSLSERAAA